jgi:chaperonin GroES
MSQAAKKLIPLLDRVLVERAVAATKTSGGILLPETVGSKVRFFGFSLLLACCC